ncbi:hypothetical protein HO173_000741 [Letharia columbiana]|uniref:SUR7 protein n=1 Tax=Letharia columbiana TaxID=112416 RepID=A0A8H6L9M9_9LECA|nr:uncharacterized protein HO173_000741 [Letharia columbiana]KAF6240948.1 hypothetical protein HO173_000741 [Letharia columbiana]
MRASDVIKRQWALVPLLFILTAFILSMLCIFAGSKRGYLEDADLFTLNTSMLGRTTLDTSKTSSSILKSIKNTVQKDVNEVISDVAKTLGIHDFYSAHILDYCEGYYTPSPFANLTSQPSKNISYCSNQTSFFHFDPAAVIQGELKPGVKLTDLSWPSAIQDGVHAVEDATDVMFVLYSIGATTTGVALIAALVGVRGVWRYSAITCVMLSSLAFGSLLLASSIANIVINKVVSAINEHGNDIGVYAYKGGTFIGMTWAATLLVLVTSFMWSYEFIQQRRGAASLGKEGEYFEEGQ